jgi:transformer-2 protein
LNTRRSSLHLCKCPSSQHQNWVPSAPLGDEDNAIGDCVVFEEGVFENPFTSSQANENERQNISEDESLIPEGWRDLQRELNVSKKEKKKRTKMMELEQSFRRKREIELFKEGASKFNTIKLPSLRFSTPESGDKQTPEDDKVLSTPFISSTPDSDNNQAQEDGKVLSTELEFSSKYIDSKLSGETESLNGENKVENESENVSVSYEHKETVTLGNEETEIGSVEDEQRVRNSVPVQAALDSSANKRVSPRNPRLELAGAGFEDIVKSFSGEYKTKDDEITEEEPRKERRQLYTPEEKILLNQRTPDLQRATSAKWIPLHILATSGQSYLLDFLLTHNVDINAVDKDGLTALHKAVLCKKEGIVNYLLKAGGSALIRDKDGATLIHYAVEVAAIQTIKLLILYKVDINLPDNHGWTPLHLAVQSKRTDVVRLLLVKGADKSIRNKDGNTPLDLCLHSGRDIRTYELIRLLKTLPKSASTQPARMEHK